MYSLFYHIDSESGHTCVNNHSLCFYDSIVGKASKIPLRWCVSVGLAQHLSYRNLDG